MNLYAEKMREAVLRSAPPYRMILRREVSSLGWLQVQEHNESQNGIGRFLLEDGSTMDIPYADISVVFRPAILTPRNSSKDSQEIS